MCFSHFPPASLMSQWNMTATPCRKTQPITSQNVQKPQISRVVIWTWRGHIFKATEPRPSSHIRRPTETQCWTSTDPPFWAPQPLSWSQQHYLQLSNLLKPHQRAIQVDFNSLLMSSYWHWTVCVCVLSGPQPCYHKPLRIRPKIRSGLELWFLFEHQQLFLLPYLCLNTNIRGKLQIINSFCHIASHIRLELSGMKNNAEQNYCIPSGKGIYAWWTRCKRSTMKKWPHH